MAEPHDERLAKSISEWLRRPRRLIRDPIPAVDGIVEQGDRLYEIYGKPLEQDHWGEYVAIFPDGRFIVGPDLEEVSDRALSEFGKGSFEFKIGEIAVYQWL